MNVHKNARLTPQGRSLAVQRVMAGEPATQVAQGCGVSVRTIWKWVARCREAGELAMQDRSSRPRRLRRQLPRHQRRQIVRARHKRWSSLRIAQYYALPVSTVVTILRRLGLNRLTRLEPPRPVLRYARRRPGTLLHLDVKKLGKIGQVGHRIHGDRQRKARGVGWEFVHVAIDDCTRVGYAEVLADEQATTTVAFLERAYAWSAALGIRIRRVLTDNGSNYRSDAIAAACRSNTALPAPTARKPTGRLNASSAPWSTNGPTPKPTAGPHFGRAPFHRIFISTTPTAVTPPSSRSARPRSTAR